MCSIFCDDMLARIRPKHPVMGSKFSFIALVALSCSLLFAAIQSGSGQAQPDTGWAMLSIAPPATAFAGTPCDESGGHGACHLASLGPDAPPMPVPAPMSSLFEISARAVSDHDPARYARFAEGVPGGPGNPFEARALYLYRDGRDTYFRIHGTTEPGRSEIPSRTAASGC